MKTKIYGASDDLIEIEGAIDEEANHYDAKNIKIACSDGTRASITYGEEANWDIKIDAKGSLFDKLIPCTNEDEPHTDEDARGCSAYSDVLVLKPGIEWVKIGRKTFK